MARSFVLGGVASCSELLLLVVRRVDWRDGGGAAAFGDNRERDGRMQRHVRRRRGLVGSHRRPLWIFVRRTDFFHEYVVIVVVFLCFD